MELILYNSTELEFKTLGIGVLTDFSSIPKVTEVLKGEYILEFDYMKNGKYSEYLLNQNIIKALGQPFRIVSVNPSNDGYRVLAKHIYYDLKNNFLEDVAPTNKTAHEALKWVLERTVFSNNFIVSGDCTELASSRYVRTTPYDAFFSADNSILSRYGGEPEFDCLNIIIHQRRGKDSGVEIREGKNLSGIKISKDFSSIITKICPVGSDGLLLPEKYVDSPLMGVYDTPRIDKREFSDIGVNEETSEEEAFELLRNACNKLFDEGLDKPVIAVSVDFIELSKTKEYEKYQNLETLELGDTLRVYIPSLKQDYLIRVIKIVKNALTGTITNLELGNEIPSLITYQSKVNSSIANDIKKSHQSALSEARDDLTKFINHPYNGHLIISEETGEIFILDTTDVSTAKEVWKFGLGGWGFSSYGIDGPYESGLTKDGHFVADWITTGKMSAERIEGLSQLILTVKNLEEEQETSKQVQGNPIEVNDAGEYELQSIQIDGKSYQETTKGNQLLDFLKLVKGQSSLNCSFENEKLIMSGDTAYAACQIVITDIYKSNNGKKLYFDFESISGNRLGAPVQLAIDNNGSMSWSRLVESDLTKKVVSIPSDTSNIRYVAIQFESNNTATVRNSNMTIVKPILSFNENAEYEEYTGGTPSPNPEYPQEIKTVQGITNEFDKSKCVRKKYVNGIVGQLATTIDSETRIFNKGMVATQNAKVSFSLGTTKALRYWLVEVDNTNTIVKVNTITTNKDTSIVTTSTTTRVEVLICWQSVDNVITLDDIADCNIMLVEGNLPERYVPYGRWLEQITHGKNFLKWEGDYSLTTTGTFVQNDYSISTTILTKDLDSMILSGDYNLLDTNLMRVVYSNEYPKVGRTFVRANNLTSNSNIIKINNNYKYVTFIAVIKPTSTLDAIKNSFQLEKETVSTEYEDYKENTALIDMNKPNLFDKNNANILNAYATINTPVITSNENFRTLYVPCESNTIYTIEKIASTRFSVSYTTELPSIGISVNNIVQNNTANKEIYQTGNNAKYLVILYYNTTTDTLSEQDILDSIKIYEGYEPYYEFAEAGDTKDEFLDGELTKRVEKLVLSSSDNWVNDGRRYYTTAYNNLMITPPNNATKAHALCSINIISATDTFEQKSGLAIHPNGSIYISNDVKTLLDNGDKIVLYIVLKEPKTYKLKYEPLKLHKGYNYITLNDDLYPNMEIKYLTDSKFNAEYATKSELEMKSNEISLGVEGKLKNYSTTTETSAMIQEKVEEESASINLSVTQKINDIQIGGTNLLKGTATATGDVASGTAGILVDVDLYGGLKSVKTNQAWAGRYFNLKAVADRGGFKTGDNLVASVFIKSDSPVIANIRMFRANSENEVKKAYNNFQITNNWQQVWFPFVADAASLTKTNTRIEVDRGTDNNYIYWAGWKLEKATKNSDWSPAPEDKLDNSKFTKAEIIAEINNGVSNVTINADNINQNGLATFMNTMLKTEGKTTINGSNIITGTIDASKVTVTNLNADNITSGTITGRTINGGTITGSVFKGETNGVKLQIGTDSNGDNYSNNSLELVKESDNSIILSIFGKFWTLANKAVYFRTAGNNFVFMDGNVSCNQLNSTSIKCNSITPQSGDNLGINGALEIRASTGYIDFHKDNSNTDYTTRIIEKNQGEFQFLKTGGYANCRGGQWINSSSRLVKKNIEEISEEEAKGLLNIKAVSFDYKNGITNNQRGFIAENILDEMPDYVIVPKDYDESKFDDTKDDNGNIDITQEVLSLDYSKFVVPLVKLCQMQQKQINDLIERIKTLESR